MLRLRSNSQTFEFVLPNDMVARWHMMLPPRRIMETKSHLRPRRRPHDRERSMTATVDTMIITIEDPSSPGARDCATGSIWLPNCAVPNMDEPVVAVTILGRENGWFDSRWTTCCEGLEKQAVAILKERC